MNHLSFHTSLLCELWNWYYLLCCATWNWIWSLFDERYRESSSIRFFFSFYIIVTSVSAKLHDFQFFLGFIFSQWEYRFLLLLSLMNVIAAIQNMFRTNIPPFDHGITTYNLKNRTSLYSRTFFTSSVNHGNDSGGGSSCGCGSKSPIG